jgi:hypothetical protein
MRRALFSIVTASMFVAGIGLASADSQTTKTSSWTSDQGAAISSYSTSKHYSSYKDPSYKPSVGMALPSKVKLYPLPATMKVPHASQYRYSIINDHPVVVESTSRKVVHSWE